MNFICRHMFDVFRIVASRKNWNNKRSLIACRMKLEVNLWFHVRSLWSMLHVLKQVKSNRIGSFWHSRTFTPPQPDIRYGCQDSGFALQLQREGREHDWTIWCGMNNPKPNSRSQIIVIRGCKDDAYAFFAILNERWKLFRIKLQIIYYY